MPRRWGHFGRKESRSAGCRACGVCCDVYGGHLWAAAEDLERWRAQGRTDLLSRVGEAGAIWCDPDTGARLEACPYLVRAPDGGGRCAIHPTKPALCRAYPTWAHANRCVLGAKHGW